MRISVVLFVLLFALSALVEVQSSSSRAQRRSSGQVELPRRRGIPGQRGRRKNIWSYNPGHRSLAFLVAGEVETASPPPLDTATGGEDRCLACCGGNAPGSVKVTPRPEPSNRVDQIVLRAQGLGEIGAEPNSVIDLCLGCCEDSVTPTPRVTPRVNPRVTPRVTPTARVTPRVTSVTVARPGGGAITQAGRELERRAPAGGRQQRWQAQRSGTREKPCAPPHCNPNWRYEFSSSSEEIPAVRRPPLRSRTQLLQSRMGSRCRHLGCRSPLGSIAGDSSSSEEDD